MDRQQLSSLLHFYVDAGLDFALEDQPVDQFSALERARKTVSPSQVANVKKSVEPPRAREPMAIPNEQAVEAAIAAASQAGDLDALRRVVETFEGCNLKRSARTTIFEGGNRAAQIMVIGDAPSGDDDINGAPFSGLDGILFANMFKSIGLDRDKDLYQSFCVPWATPGNGAPTPLHLKICAPFLHRQIELAKPQMLVVLGNAAAQHIFGSTKSIVSLRGKWQDTRFGSHTLPVIATHEPGFLRTQPGQKRNAWMDLLAIKTVLEKAADL